MINDRRPIFEYADRVMSAVLYQSIAHTLPAAILEEVDDAWLDDMIKYIGEVMGESTECVEKHKSELRDILRRMLHNTIQMGLNKACATYEAGETSDQN